MKRRSFLSAGSALAVTAATPLLAPIAAFAEKKPRFEFGVQQYTFRKAIQSGELPVLDYPQFCHKELGVKHIEYWSGGLAKYEDAAFCAELKKRSEGEGLNNLLILVDMRDRLDAKDADQRKRSIDAHKKWVDCAKHIGCEAIRINVASGGDKDENLKQAKDGIPPLLDYAKKANVEILVENHGGNSGDGKWVQRLMRELDHTHFGTLPDFGNFREYDRYEGVKEMMPWAGAVCAKSHSFDDDGKEKKIDYFKMLKIVTASTYRGPICIEFEGGDITPVEGSIKTRDLVRRAVEAAGSTIA